MPVDLRPPPDLSAFRDDVRAFLAGEMAADRVAGHLDPTDLTGLDEGFERAHHRRAAARGYVGISAPVEHGGGGRPRSWAATYMFEAAYHDAPSIDTAWALCGATLVTFGSPGQLATLMPPIVRGERTGCIAYTEPGAGSDLAALETRAEPDGDGWVLHGRKALVTAGHKADFCVTIAVTDPDAPPRRGMSMFIFDLPWPGVTVHRRTTVNRWTLSEIEFDRARLPAGALLGRRDGGWAQLVGALTQERSGMAHLGWATRVIEELEAWDAARPGPPDPAAREVLARLRVELATGVHLSTRVLRAQDRGEPAIEEAASAKVYATELLQRVARAGSDLVGIEALEHGVLFDRGSGAPLRGRLAWEVQERIHPTISVGANEVQRDLIARMALGLPSGRS